MPLIAELVIPHIDCVAVLSSGRCRQIVEQQGSRQSWTVRFQCIREERAATNEGSLPISRLRWSDCADEEEEEEEEEGEEEKEEEAEVRWRQM